MIEECEEREVIDKANRENKRQEMKDGNLKKKGRNRHERKRERMKIEIG